MSTQAEREKSIVQNERNSVHRNKWHIIYTIVIGTLIIIIISLYFFTLYFR